MATEVLDQAKLEAVCFGCRKSFAFIRSNLNQRFVCRHCGFSSFLTANMVLNKIPVFTKAETKSETKIEAKKDNFKCLFRYFRHGADTPQAGVLLELTTSKVKFSTRTKLIIGSKIYFFLKDKKFIVNIKQISSTESSNSEQYEVSADYEVVLTGELKEKVINPHYLIR